jgi:acyl dehydratase
MNELLRGMCRKTEGRTVTEADIVQFAALTRDFSRLHTDADYAARSIFGRRVGHGLLGLAIAEGLLARAAAWPGIVAAWDWTFSGAFFSGDTLYAEAEVIERRPFLDFGILIERVLVRNGETVIQVGRHAVVLAPGDGLYSWFAAFAQTPVPAFAPQLVAELQTVPESTSTPDAHDETGVFFEDLAPGSRFTTPAITIGDYDISAFLGLVGDPDPWFQDRTLARRAGLAGSPIPPLFGLTLVEGLKYALAPARGVGIPMASLSWRWRHERALARFATVAVDATIGGRRASASKHDRGVISQSIALRQLHGPVFQTGQHLQMLRRRPRGPAGGRAPNAREIASDR